MGKCLFPILMPMILLLLLGSCGGASQRYEPELARNLRQSMGLKGQVLAMREEEVVLGRNAAGGVDTVAVNLKELRFDGEGRALQEEKRVFGRLESLRISSYDTAGRLDEVQEFDLEGKMSRSWTYLYGKNGKLAEKQGFTAEGKMFEKEAWEYDSENRPLWSTTALHSLRPQGGTKRVRYRSDFAYKGDSTLETKTVDGTLSQISHFFRGRLCKSELYQADGESISGTLAYQDSADVRTTVRRNQNGKLVERSQRESGPFGPVSERKFGPDGLLYLLETTDYDSLGLVIRQVSYNVATQAPGTALDTARVKPLITDFRYRFDGQQNWTERRGIQSDSMRELHCHRKFIYAETP